jgi:hypothetical protein
MTSELEAHDMLDGTVVDPAVTAATAAKLAERAFLAVPANSLVDELGTAFVTAQVRWQRADEAFADAVPTSKEGALLKLRALEEAHEAMGTGEDSLELRHIRALMTFLHGCIERRDA